MEVRKCRKESFVVVGKEGSTEAGEGFIQKLWEDAKCRLRVHPKSVEKMKKKIRELTTRGNKWSNKEREKKLREYTMGWINYFRYADMKSLMERTDEWLRHRIRAVYWKQ